MIPRTFAQSTIHHKPVAANLPTGAARQPVGWGPLALATLLGSVLLAAPALAGAKAPKGTDPFAGDTWHAVYPSWPGTLEFDGKKKSVVLQPVGAPRMEATYSYKLDKAAAKGRVTGELTLSNTQGQTSAAKFKIEGPKKNKLTLEFPTGAEHYDRMTKAEEAAAVESLRKRLAIGQPAAK